MTTRHSLGAEPRQLFGKNNGKLRRDGKIPGVIYGPVIEAPISVTVDTKELDRLYHGYGMNTLIELQHAGETYTVYMRRVTFDRVKRQPLHAEFFAPNMRVELTTRIPVLTVGELAIDNAAPAIVTDSAEVRGLPDAIPSALEVDLGTLTAVGQSIRVGDLQLPENVTLLSDPETVLVQVVATRGAAQPIEEEEAEAAEEAIEAAAEAGGADAAGEAAEPAEEA